MRPSLKLRHLSLPATLALSITMAQAQGINLQDIASVAPSLPEVTIYTADKIITMDERRPEAEAVAVSGKRILAVGDLAELEAASEGQPYRIDRRFEDKVLMPGFVEPHVHPFLASLALTTNVISIEDWDTPTGFSPAVRDADGYRERLISALADHDPSQTFFTWGYHHYFHGELNRETLNELAPDFPVIVWHRSAHEMILNDKALELTGIDEAFFATMTEGAQSQSDLGKGHFYEQGLFGILGQVGPHFITDERVLGGMEFAETYYHREGITTAAEPGGLYSKGIQDYANRVHAEGPLNHYFIPDGKSIYELHPDDGDAMLATTEDTLTWGEGQAIFLPKQVKLFSDGAMYSQLMQMRDGYTDGHEGEWIMYPENYVPAFNRYWDAGYQIHVHTNGDGGLDLVVTTLQAAMRRNPRFDHRMVVHHFGFATLNQAKALADLGALVSANPYYVNALGTRYAEVGIGPERAANMAPMRWAAEAGLPLSFHSDMPMAPAKPLGLVWSAVNRITAEGEVIGPNQRLDLSDALRAITIDAAFTLQLENEIGSITPGKFANFAVLGADPYAVAPEELHQLPVWGTVFEGRVQPAPRRPDEDEALPQKAELVLPPAQPHTPIWPGRASARSGHSHATRQLMEGLARQLADG